MLPAYYWAGACHGREVPIGQHLSASCAEPCALTVSETVESPFQLQKDSFVAS